MCVCVRGWENPVFREFRDKATTWDCVEGRDHSPRQSSRRKEVILERVFSQGIYFEVWFVAPSVLHVEMEFVSEV